MTERLNPARMPLEYWSGLSPERVALVVNQQSYTWNQIQARVQALVDFFIKQGMAENDCLVLLGKNHQDLVWCYLAAMQIGVKVSFLAPGPVGKIDEKLTTLTAPAQALWLYTVDESLCRDHHHDMPATVQWLSFPQLDLLIPSGTDRSKLSAYQADNLASLTFTSGSMGKPKAVAHTHRQHFASAKGLLEQFNYQSGDTWLLSLPLYHVSGLAIIYRWLYSGACLKIGSGDLSLDIADVTHASLVPVQLQRLLGSRQSINLTHVLLGGSHIPVQLCQQASQRGIETWLGYGMTEAASTVTAKQFDGRPGTGYLLPGRKLKIDQQKIYIAGETLALGYYLQGAITPLTQADGWFDSKDVGYWLDNQLIVQGRADNMFISGGENIHCEEIESVLSRHPQIDVAMVVPVEDVEYGQRAVAVIYSQNSLPEQNEIEHWLAGQLEKFKWPTRYLSLPEQLLEQGIKLPRSAVKAWVEETLQHSVMR
jgi:O-succinylbenzoic acid--CoA ligase